MMAVVKISACFLIEFYASFFFSPCLKSGLRIFFKPPKKERAFPHCCRAREVYGGSGVAEELSQPEKRRAPGEDKSPSARSRIKKK